jgi:hypothetical protein
LTLLIARWLGAAALLAIMSLPVAAQDANRGAPPPLKPGGTRLTTKLADPSLWIVKREGRKALYVCKPLACPDKLRVSLEVQPSPTRNPNPQALEKFAKVEYPKRLAAANAANSVLHDRTDKLETLLAEVATLLNSPAVRNDTKLTQASGDTYLSTAIIFAGPLMITLIASSPDRALAGKTLLQFVDGMKIETAPAGQTPAIEKPSNRAI